MAANWQLMNVVLSCLQWSVDIYRFREKPFQTLKIVLSSYPSRYEQALHTRGVAGSIPASPTTRNVAQDKKLQMT
jgi:hypothetical protein